MKTVPEMSLAELAAFVSAYYHWNDRQCLKQAEMVARHESINLSEIER